MPLPHGVASFPLIPVVKGPDGGWVCGCGDADCKRAGKHPAYPWSQVGVGEEVPGPEDGPRGICTGTRSGVFVVDFDGPEAAQIASTLGEWPETYTVKTARGLHLYYLCPKFLIKTSGSKLAPKVDIRGEGGFAVAPGAVHKSGAVYEVVDDRDPVEAPAWLLAWPGLQSTAVNLYSADAIGPDHPDWSRRLEDGRRMCLEHPPNGGTSGMWPVALHLVRTLELPLDVAHQLIAEHYNPRCDPPWSDAEIDHKLLSARDKSSRPTGLAPEGFLESVFSAPIEKLVPQTGPIPRKRHDPLHQYTHEANAAASSQCVVITFNDMVAALTTHTDWRGVWQWDEFRQRVYAVDPPMQLDAEQGNLSRADAAEIWTWFIHEGGKVAKDNILDACVAAAKMCRYHPVLEYLDTLPAPTTHWLNDLARRLFGAEDEIYQRFLRCQLVASVRRARVPGTKVDTMVVLTGKGGRKKSTIIEVLYGEDVTRSQMPDLSSTDASQALQGFWCVEFSEMDRIIRSKGETVVKDWISRRFDDYRAPYGYCQERHPRATVPWGTTNEEEMLHDDGAEDRRYYPIPVVHEKETMIQMVEWLRAHRDEIWAEANALAADKNFQHWIDRESDTYHIKEKFTEEDIWTDTISEYLQGKESVTVADVYVQAICGRDMGAMARVDKKIQRRVSDILKRLGCKRGQVGVERKKVWLVPEDIAKKQALNKSAEEKLNKIIG